MSAVLITAGVYGFFRVCAFGLGRPDANWGLVLMGIGTLSAILGVLYALTQNDLKRLLAYSTIENSGIMMLALGAGVFASAHGRADLAAVAVAASLYHVLNHAAFKGLLFLGAGGVVMSVGSRKLEEFGGLLRRMPWTGVFFLIGAIAIAGLPPLNGFVSEWMAFQALLLGFSSFPGLVRLNFPLAGALLALTSALAAACFVKAFGIAFLALPRSRQAADAHESPMVMLVPQGLLAAVCVGLGLFPGLVLRTIERVLTSLPGVAPGVDPAAPLGVWGMTSQGTFDHIVPVLLVVTLAAGIGIAAWLAVRRAASARRVPTWGCGGELSARTEYSATAFSKPLMMVFRAVYRPTREVDTLAEASPYFPHEVRYRAEIEPTFERYLYGPMTRAVLRVADAMRVLQAGSLHAYLAYVLVLGVLLLIWLGGSM
jgi:hydrogenase-4 component B